MNTLSIWRHLTCLAAFACVLQGCSSAPQSFATPDAAVDTLVAALRSDDQAQLSNILGPKSSDVLSSGDAVADANARAEFLRLYDEKHTLTEPDADTRTLEVGQTDWPMPIPIVKDDKGWSFDTAAGLDELLSRRIGRNELAAIQVCLAIDDAEREFVQNDYDGDGWREYAQTFNSDPGKTNGLYWPPAENHPQSPLGELVATATEEGYKGRAAGETGPRPYHGYLYRILTAQGPDAPGGAVNYIAQGHMIGGFAVIAWPAEYANSGLKSFMVSHQGIVYERDLGDDTDRIARNMKSFDPGTGWERADATPK
jgi:hypothetical protein